MINLRTFLVNALFSGAIFSIIAAEAPIPRESRLLDDKWTFTLTPDSVFGMNQVTKTVDLPHDWSVEFPFMREAASGNDGGYVCTGKGVYTKEIDFTKKQLEGAKYSLMFEGVYERWTLKVNGKTIGFRPYGYSSVIYDITPYLHAGMNRIEVEVDNSHQKNSRWFTGSGIYRHVHLIRTGETAVAPWSLYVTTSNVTRNSAIVNVSFDIEGLKENGKGMEATFRIYTPTGGDIESSVPVTGNTVSARIRVRDPKLWSMETPSLYRMEVDLKKGNEIIDRVEDTFGIRTITYSAKEGLRLNGEPIVLNGACAHHDNGLLGAASYDAAEARKVKLLKEAGFNAVRTSHNPPAPAFLRECDRQGLLVIDEAFDGWRDSKTPNDYHLWIDEWGVRDMGDLVRRDRNHPSVMAWSIGNEVIERKKIEVISTARKLAGECRRLDPTRPVTEALCAWDSDWEIYDPHAEVLDITGYNYMIHKSESDHERCPDRVMWQTESYPRDAASNWHKVKENPYIIGDFVWTGLDYLGESGIGRFFYEGQTPGEHYQNDQWPWHGAYCGDVDITGWRKPISHYRDMLYNDGTKLYMAVREPDGYNGEIRETQWSVWPTWESWNWKGHEGKPIEVEVISRYPKVRLYQDGKLIGEKETGERKDCKSVFTLNYAPGALRAAGVSASGTEVESVMLFTAGAPASIRLTPDKTVFNADGQDLVYVVAEVVDEDGNVVPDEDVTLTFSVAGNAEVKASGSADLTTTGSYATDKATTWKGRAMTILKAGAKRGDATLKVTAPGMKPATLKLQGK